jgi:hypothetical protein
MSRWRVPATFFIAPGATSIIRFWWPPGSSDQGAQWAMAHPLAGASDSWLMTERVGKRRPCEIGTIAINGEPQYGCAATGADVEYRVFIRNDGASGTRYQLEGGGF